MEGNLGGGIGEKNPVYIVDKLLTFPVNLESNLMLIIIYQNNLELLTFSN